MGGGREGGRGVASVGRQWVGGGQGRRERGRGAAVEGQQLGGSRWQGRVQQDESGVQDCSDLVLLKR